MPTGSKVFLAMRDACGLQPCDRTHLKTTFCQICTLVGRMINIQGHPLFLVRGRSYRISADAVGILVLSTFRSLRSKYSFGFGCCWTSLATDFVRICNVWYLQYKMYSYYRLMLSRLSLSYFGLSEIRTRKPSAELICMIWLLPSNLNYRSFFFTNIDLDELSEGINGY